MRRVFTLCSVAVHAVVITAALIAQVLAIGSLPTPRRPLTFDGAQIIRVTDLPLQSSHRHAARGGGPSLAIAPEPAPIDAATDIGPETERDSDGSHGNPLDAVGVEHGLGQAIEIGVVEGIPPPPPVTTQAPIRVHAGMQPPRKIVDVRPVYPALAQSARTEGVVIIEAVIDERGHVASVLVLRSIPLLDQAAVEAVRQWVFTPTLLNDVPVPVVMTVTVQFTLQER
jgi:protein TonB